MPLYKWDGRLLVVQNKLAVAQACCCGGTGDPCNYCTGDTAATIEVVIAGITNGTCSDCASANGTFLCTQQSACLWEYDRGSELCASGCCGFRWVYVGFYNHTMYAGWTNHRCTSGEDPSGLVYFSKDFSPSWPSCRYEGAIPYLGCCEAALCNFSNATCSVRPV